MTGIRARTTRYRNDGIRTVEDLRARCRIDDETGCWLWGGALRDGKRPVVWIPGHGAGSIQKAIALLVTGELPPRGRVWLPTCCRTDCANPAHRRLGTVSEMSKLLRPSLTPQHRAAITVAARRARGKITSEVAALIRAADGTGVEIGALHGLGESQTMKIRRGLAWAPLPWSSVFALGAAS